MSRVKSLDELKKIRENALDHMNIRQVREGEHSIKLTIGMATCGIAAGARETFNALVDEIEKRDLKNVYVVKVGCMGHCHSEPIVEVNSPGQKPILYGNIDKKRARELIEKHIQHGEMLEDLIISKSFHRI